MYNVHTVGPDLRGPGLGSINIKLKLEKHRGRLKHISFRRRIDILTPLKTQVCGVLLTTKSLPQNRRSVIVIAISIN